MKDLGDGIGSGLEDWRAEHLLGPSRSLGTHQKPLKYSLESVTETTSQDKEMLIPAFEVQIAV